ncbi:uncharacterized protein LOC131879074 isoform X2 [Tigriopus californicus]|uniref:uncharacterized protein LOC131879074 isoform X2 n=1 Tax=Tigriopus californicus TaxID=6832 RepID=UPI0027D9D20C|nr:uncharacterized protein LOC131879074 isoform X2 [Tigriopus californicus]
MKKCRGLELNGTPSAYPGYSMNPSSECHALATMTASAQISSSPSASATKFQHPRQRLGCRHTSISNGNESTNRCSDCSPTSSSSASSSASSASSGSMASSSSDHPHSKLVPSPSSLPRDNVQQRLQDTSSFDLIESGEGTLPSPSAELLHVRIGQPHHPVVEEEGEIGHEPGPPSPSPSDQQRKSSNPLVRLLYKLTRKQVEEKRTDITLDMLQPSRYKPNDLNQMAEDTKFSKREVRSLYRAFKQECPNGIVDEETFKDVYEKIFPLGDATHYAHLVFLAIDRDRTGGITFGDFMEFLSVITKGSLQDKLLWAFTFYDVDHDGFISKDEMLKVTDAIHELMGSKNTSNTLDAHINVDRIFETMDLNRDGLISMEEFVQYCTSTTEVRESLEVLPYMQSERQQNPPMHELTCTHSSNSKCPASIALSFPPSSHPPIHPSIHPSTYLSIHLSIHPVIPTFLPKELVGSLCGETLTKERKNCSGMTVFQSVLECALFQAACFLTGLLFVVVVVVCFHPHMGRNTHLRRTRALARC